MGFRDSQFSAWSVRDSGELWRPVRHSSSPASPATSREGPLERCSIEDLAALEKGLKRHGRTVQGQVAQSAPLSQKNQRRLPPRWPRTPSNLIAPLGQPNLELTIQCLSPRPIDISEGDDDIHNRKPGKSIDRIQKPGKASDNNGRPWSANSISTFHNKVSPRRSLDKIETVPFRQQLLENADGTMDGNKSDSAEALVHKSFKGRTAEKVICFDNLSKEVSSQDDDHEKTLFSGMDLENPKYMLTDDSETDFWECQTHEEENETGFHQSNYFPKETKDLLAARLMLEEDARASFHLESDGMNDSTTVCTLNGERVIMQTNFAFQHTEQDLTGYAQASRDYLDSQEHVMSYFENLPTMERQEEDLMIKKDHPEDGNAFVNTSLGTCSHLQQEENKETQGAVQDDFSVSGKRRWPRITKTPACNAKSRAGKFPEKPKAKQATDAEKHLQGNTKHETNEESHSARDSIGRKSSSHRSKHLKASKRNRKPVMKRAGSWSKFGKANGCDDDNGPVQSLCIGQSLENKKDNCKEKMPTSELFEENMAPACRENKVSSQNEEDINKTSPEIIAPDEVVRAQEDATAQEQQPGPSGEDVKVVVKQEIGERNSLSAEKFCSILSFLKQVEETNLEESRTGGPLSKVADGHSPRTVLEHDDGISLAESIFTSASLTLPEEASHLKMNSADSAFSGIRKRIHELKEKILKQKDRIAELEAEKENLKTQKDREISLEREKYSKELQDQAAEYKSAIKKHLSISEKSMKDKEALSERCCSLTTSLNTAEAKFEEKMKAANEQWAFELKKQKEAWSAGEKARREAWIEKKTKEIKEMTVVGLEPHIESIHECHKKELQALEERHNEEVSKKLQKQIIKHRQEMSEMREQLLKERDELLDKERLAAHSRINEMAEKYEQQALQQRMRIANDLAMQLERSEASRRDDKQYTQELLARCQKEAAEREEILRRQHERLAEDLQLKAQAEVSALKARMDSERAEWQHTLHERVCKELNAREEEIEARCMEERNKEIELIIDRMEKEKEDAISEHRREKMSRVDELLQEKKTLLKKLKDNEVHYTDLCKSVLEAKTRAETERSELNTKIDLLKAEIRHQSTVTKQLQEQAGTEKHNARMQREKLEACLMKQEEQLRSTVLELQKCRGELENVRIRKVEELAELENKVKVAIEKKDEIISGLRSQLESAHHQIRHTEELLQQEHSILFG